MALSTPAKVGIGLAIGAGAIGLTVGAVLLARKTAEPSKQPVLELDSGLHQVDVGRRYLLRPSGPWVGEFAGFRVEWVDPDGTLHDPAPPGAVLATLGDKGIEAIITKQGTAGVVFQRQLGFGVDKWILNAGGPLEAVAMLGEAA